LHDSMKKTVNCIILEYAEKGELYELIARDKFGEDLALYIFK